MIICPFFAMCIDHEPNEHRQVVLANLIFGKGALIFKRADGCYYLSFSDSEFKIPDEYSDEAYKEFSDKYFYTCPYKQTDDNKKNKQIDKILEKYYNKSK